MINKREFQKHEVLTVEKLEQALNNLHKDTDANLDEKENQIEYAKVLVDSEKNDVLESCKNVQIINSSPKKINPDDSGTESCPLLSLKKQIEFEIEERSKNNYKTMSSDEIMSENKAVDKVSKTNTDKVTLDKEVAQLYPNLTESKYDSFIETREIKEKL